MSTLLLLLLLLLLLAQQSVVSYEKHAVWRLRVTTEAAHAVVANATRSFEADLWAEYGFYPPLLSTSVVLAS